MPGCTSRELCTARAGKKYFFDLHHWRQSQSRRRKPSNTNRVASHRLLPRKWRRGGRGGEGVGKVFPVAGKTQGINGGCLLIFSCVFFFDSCFRFWGFFHVLTLFHFSHLGVFFHFSCLDFFIFSILLSIFGLWGFRGEIFHCLQKMENGGFDGILFA